VQRAGAGFCGGFRRCRGGGRVVRLGDSGGIFGPWVELPAAAVVTV
jgi:hypothetical protein